MKKIKIFLLLILLIEVTLSYAQVTTSSISGQVTDPDGLPVDRAVIVAVHTPTNSQYSAFTDHEGNYSILNMRSGGPYLVVVRLLGYQDVKVNNVNLALSGNLVLDIEMEIESIDLLGVVIFTNSKNTNMLTNNAGAITNVSARDNSLMPAINRNINDIMRFTPQANGAAIGGGNYRQNFVTVDGAAFNNAFGIGQNLPGNGSPISIEALEQVSVSLTPYDVRQSGFIGANINAVTKSGTNEFKGSLYTYMTDDRLRGNRVGDTYINHPSSKTNLSGITFGGPVVKNKLFFFANYETQNTIAPGPARVASTNGVAERMTIARPTVDDMNMMSKYLRDTYGYETGPYQGYSFESPGKKFLTRVDWNITPYHKFNLRYSYMDSKTPFNPSSSSPYIPSGGGRTPNNSSQNMNAMWYQNTGYFQHFNFSSFSGELNSRFMEGKLNNLLRVTCSNQDEPRSANGKVFPFVDIIKDNAVYASFGTELFSYNNLRRVKTWNITEELEYNLGINNLTLGLSYETNHIRNGFMRQGAGYYAFNSWDDFVNGADPAYYSITFSNVPGYKQVFPGFKFDQYSLYLQNEVKIGDRLNLTGGLRFDLPTYPAFPEALQTHPMILELDFNGKHYNTAAMPKQRIMFSPRFGFNYDVTGDRKIVLRGGTGIFTGRIPFVWICSQSGDAGMLQTTMAYTEDDPKPGPFNPDPKAYLPSVQPPAGTSIPTGGFTVMDPDFKMPSAWKTSLAVDFQLPLGFNASIEGVYNKDINVVMIRNEGLVEPEPMNIPGYPDHRLIYPYRSARFIHRLATSTGLPDDNARSGAQPLLIHNVKSNGYYSSLTFKLEKEIGEGVSGMIAYTRSYAKSLFDGYGDQSMSLWNSYTTVNGSNTPELGYAGYVMPNNLIGSFSYKYKSFTASVFYIGGNGGRASYTYTNNIVQDGNSFQGANLIYIPKDPSEISFTDATIGSGANAVTYTAQEQSNAFFQYIEQDSYLRSRKGQYAERNGVVFPWVHTFDVKLTQDFIVKAGKTNHTLQLGLDIINVGNLINSNWGNRRIMSQSRLLEVTNTDQITADGTVVPTFRFNPISGTTDLPSTTFRKSENALSTYQMQFSLRYIFN